MKQLIVLAAVLPLLLLFMVQVTVEQRNSSIAGQFQDCVYTAKEQAKQEGCFNKEIQANLRKSISSRTGIPEGQVQIQADSVPKYRVNRFEPLPAGRRELIHYKVSIPISQLMAGSKLFGISKEQNQAVYTIESDTASERLPVGVE